MTLMKFFGFMVVAWMAVGVHPLAASADLEQHPQRRDGSTEQATPDTGRPSDWKWWADADVRGQLRLTDDQVVRLQALFDRRATESAPFVALLRLQREKLDSMTRERRADRATYADQVSHILDLQSRILESRIVMLYEMFLELRPEQYQKLQELLQRNSESSRGRSSEVRRP